jgi:hypothetical protein
MDARFGRGLYLFSRLSWRPLLFRRAAMVLNFSHRGQ